MRRLLRWLLVAVLAALLIFAVAGVPLYVSPKTDELHKADAIFVLGGSGDGRYTAALELALKGLAPRVVMSNPIASTEGNIWLADLCEHKRYDFDVMCFLPDPMTTRGEARELGRLATEEGWHSVIVVTYTPQISRARYIIDRCYDGEVMMANTQEDVAVSAIAWNYMYQTAGFARAFLQSGC
ncbi:YdcF family protein [Aldersonia sp. NBC_00410]|uniref:YdcF family protein n=1 Tax=Aldersonia sp. NBC_00410 TaxID=2975954 RepID=UPI00225260EB|nr:YdcF family protein [Aldersonia sp. NBC_00410]MCX5041703.1 YdcF family protein [Aldersonia sp. NBC_00410]